MARIAGVDPKEAGLFTRVLYALTRRKVKQLAGRAEVMEPIRVVAHHPRLLLAQGLMELGQEAAKSLPAGLKTLCHVRAAMLIGCPF